MKDILTLHSFLQEPFRILTFGDSGKRSVKNSVHQLRTAVVALESSET